MATWSDVSRLMKALPGIEKSTERREWRVKGKLLAWERPLRPADHAALGKSAPTGPILGVHVPLEAKEMLLESQGHVYFTTPHFDGWPALLVRLPAISVKELSGLLRQSWFERAPKRLVLELETRATAKVRPARRREKLRRG